jgi:hypothetical protein
MMLINTRLVRMGPIVSVKTTRGSSFSICSALAGMPLTPPIASSTPPHEIKNVRTKYIHAE